MTLDVARMQNNKETNKISKHVQPMSDSEGGWGGETQDQCGTHGADPKQTDTGSQALIGKPWDQSFFELRIFVLFLIFYLFSLECNILV